MSWGGKERPILMNAPMVRATLRQIDPKWQTRRIAKPQFSVIHAIYPDASIVTNRIFRGDNQTIKCPYGTVGDRLWVRETWAEHPEFPKTAIYRTDRGGDYQGEAQGYFKWKPSIHMPRWASRLTLEITEVRVQRVQEISEGDAKAEGAEFGFWHQEQGVFATPSDEDEENASSYRDGFGFIWESIHGIGSWERNDWVWAISFRRIEP